MKYRLFGRSGLRVSELCLGAMGFGTEWGQGADKEESRKIFDAFAESGGNFIDTANRYTEGTSEKFLGEFLQGQRDKFVIASKYSLMTATGDLNDAGNSRKNMIRSLEGSLKRLNTDYLDIFYVHVWDSTTPIEEILRGMDDLVSMGKVNYIAFSDTPAWIVSNAIGISEVRGMISPAGIQAEYSLLKRDAERDLIPMSKHFDLAVTCWAPLGGGVLTGKYLNGYKEGMRIKPESIRLNERNRNIALGVSEIANKTGISSSHIAIKWLIQQQGVIIPIVGVRTLEQLKDNLESLKHTLDDELMNYLNELTKIELGFPHDFLAGDIVKNLAFGGMYDSLINHRLKS